jgi:hypothetical protein
MKGNTIFILPTAQEFDLIGILNVAVGDEVLVDEDAFGTDLLRCESVTHHLIRRGDVHRYVRRVFLK